LEELWGAVIRGSQSMEQCENQPAERKVYYSREWLFSDLDNELNRMHEVGNGLGLSLRRRLKCFAA